MTECALHGARGGQFAQLLRHAHAGEGRGARPDRVVFGGRAWLTIWMLIDILNRENNRGWGCRHV
jgi:hypothetical protein